MKKCIDCGETKPLEAFGPYSTKRVPRTQRRYSLEYRTMADGRRTRCRLCHRNLPSRSKESRLLERQKAATKNGRVHRTVGERKALTVARKAARKQGQVFISPRFKREMLYWWNGATPKSDIYRLRYRTDPVFRVKEIARAWSRKAASGVLRTDGRTTKRISDDGTLNAAVIRNLFANATHCAYCQQVMGSRDKTLDHMEPTSRGGAHSIHNVVIACRSCNSRKHTMSYAAYVARCGLSTGTAAVAFAGPNRPFAITGDASARDFASDRCLQ